MSIGQVRDSNCQWRFQDVINACRLYEQEERKRNEPREIKAKYPTCTQECSLVSCGLVFVCISHGNLHVCTRDTCEFIVDKKDEHKQVCILTGLEYIREFDMIYNYDEADEDALDPDDLLARQYAVQDSDDEINTRRFNHNVASRREKRKRKLEKYDSTLIEKNIISSLMSSSSSSSSVSIYGESNSEKTNDDAQDSKEPLHPGCTRKRHKKNKNICDMTELEKKEEISRNSFFIHDAISKLNINSARVNLVYEFIMDTWIIVNRKDMNHMKSKSTFYDLFMHASVAFKCIQDGMNGVIDKIEHLYKPDVTNKQLTATEICAKLSVNSKYYTHCCSIFRQIMKLAVDQSLLKDYSQRL